VGTEEAGQDGDLQSMKVLVARRRDRGVPVGGYGVPDGEGGGCCGGDGGGGGHDGADNKFERKRRELGLWSERKKKSNIVDIQRASHVKPCQRKTQPSQVLGSSHYD